MPLPLSATSTAMCRSPSRRVVVIVIRPGPGSIAWAALLRRFKNTWLIWEGEQVIAGISPKFFLTAWPQLVPGQHQCALEAFVQVELPTLLRSSREKFLRLITISEICAMPPTTRPLPGLQIIGDVTLFGLAFKPAPTTCATRRGDAGRAAGRPRVSTSIFDGFVKISRLLGKNRSSSTARCRISIDLPAATRPMPWRRAGDRRRSRRMRKRSGHRGAPRPGAASSTWRVLGTARLRCEIRGDLLVIECRCVLAVRYVALPHSESAILRAASTLDPARVKQQHQPTSIAYKHRTSESLSRSFSARPAFFVARSRALPRRSMLTFREWLLSSSMMDLRHQLSLNLPTGFLSTFADQASEWWSGVTKKHGARCSGCEC